MHYIAILSVITNILFNRLPATATLPLKVFVAVNTVFGLFMALLYFHHNFYAIVALFTRVKVWPEARARHKYAYLICAHDEENVVGYLVKSILSQKYPQELMQVFVCADNCTDATADVARRAGAVVFERTSEQRGKSYALDYSLKRLLAEYAGEHFEAVFFFDADNLVDANYTEEMNKLFDRGIPVATSFRASKNVGQNWITAGSSYMFYREYALIHHARASLGLGTYVSGTGFYIAMALIEKMGGWNYRTITEDIEFSMDCALQDIKIGYNENAIFYDEQPVTFKDSCHQRFRWSRGMHECFYKYFVKRLKNTLCSGVGIIRLEMSVHISPLPVLNFVWSFIYPVALAFAVYFGHDTSAALQSWFLSWALPSSLLTLAMLYLLIAGYALIAVIKKHKQIDMPLAKQIGYCFTFPLLFASSLPLSLVALFRRGRWTKIPHTVAKGIGDFEKN